MSILSIMWDILEYPWAVFHRTTCQKSHICLFQKPWAPPTASRPARAFRRSGAQNASENESATYLRSQKLILSWTKLKLHRPVFYGSPKVQPPLFIGWFASFTIFSNIVEWFIIIQKEASLKKRVPTTSRGIFDEISHNYPMFERCIVEIFHTVS